MKRTISTFLAATALFSLAAAVNAADAKYTSEKDKFSYAVGVQMGTSLKQQNVTDINAKVIGQAIADVLSGTKLKLSQEEMQAAIAAFQQTQQAKRKEQAKATKAAGDKFRAKNKKRKGVTELPSGIQYEVIKKGKGDKPKSTDQVTVHYAGTLINGKEFDSSIKRGTPTTFPLNGVIKGWQEILALMPTGAKWKVVIPPELAYGERGAGASIGPNETLIFEIELISIGDKK